MCVCVCVCVYLLTPAYLSLSLTLAAHVIAKAKGLAVLSVIKAGFLVTARGGSGVVLARLPDGSKWRCSTWEAETPHSSLSCLCLRHRESDRLPTPQTIAPGAPLRCPGCPASPGSNPRSSLLLQDARRDSVGLALSGTHLPFFHRADIKHDKICVLLLNTSSHSSTSWYHGFLPLRGVLQGNGSHLGTSPGSCRSHFNKHPWSGIVWRLI